jgi:hypothetical protein
MSILDWYDYYKDARIETVPLPFNEKAPPPKGWLEKIEDNTLWDGVSEPLNIGVVAGKNDLLILDPDDANSVSYINNFMQGLGIEHVGTKTKRGEHWWIRSELPDSFNKKSAKLSAPQKGDIRFRNGYALAAPSILPDYRYLQIGNPFKVPRIDWKDIQPLVNSREVEGSSEETMEYEGLPVPMIRREIPEYVIGLSNILRNAPKGEPINIGERKWDTRSEATFSGFMSLLIRGYDPNEIVYVLKMKDRNYDWYRIVEKGAIQEICNIGYRPALARLYHSPIQIPTRTGSTDYTIFLAIISLAWFLNSKELFLPVRELAMLSATDKETVVNSLPRLVELGLLAEISSIPYLNTALETTKFSIQSGYIDSSLSCNSMIPNDPTNQNNVSYVRKNRLFPELWRDEALGKSPFHIFMMLDSEPKTKEQIQELTGLTDATFYRSIKRLVADNLAIRDGTGWSRGNANIVELEKKYDCALSSYRRKQAIEIEREKGYHFFSNCERIKVNGGVEIER